MKSQANDVDSLRDQLRKAEAACAAKDAALREWMLLFPIGAVLDESTARCHEMVKRALAPDCGKDYVPRADLDAMTERLESLKRTIHAGDLVPRADMAASFAEQERLLTEAQAERKAAEDAYLVMERRVEVVVVERDLAVMERQKNIVRAEAAEAKVKEMEGASACYRKAAAINAESRDALAAKIIELATELGNARRRAAEHATKCERLEKVLRAVVLRSNQTPMGDPVRDMREIAEAALKDSPATAPAVAMKAVGE